jgi:hypothetical protein
MEETQERVVGTVCIRAWQRRVGALFKGCPKKTVHSEFGLVEIPCSVCMGVVYSPVACRFPYLLRMEWDACSYGGCVCMVVESRVTLSALFVEGAARVLRAAYSAVPVVVKIVEAVCSGRAGEDECSMTVAIPRG